MSLLYAHLVTKYLRRVFNDAMLTDCQTVLAAVCVDLDAELIEFNGEPDLVHLLVRYPPTVSISELPRRMKDASARAMRADYTRRCNRARRGHFWSPSHFAVSTGGAPLSITNQYIDQQNRPL